MSAVGKSIIRVDAYDKVTGRAKYTDDLCDKSALVAKIVHSTIAHGWVNSVDISEAMKVPGVVKIDAEYELAEGFTTISTVLQLVSYGVIAVLLVVSLLIISNTVKIAMYDRRDEIAIMKMVGATNGFIRLPFVVEGFTLGMIGAILAFCLEWVMYDAMCEKIAGVDSLQLFTFVPFQELLIPMVAVFAAAGMFVGIVGSWTSIRKFMDV